MEYLDIVDDNGEPTGHIVERKIAHREGILHRTAHLWLLRRKDGQTEVLLQKRSENKSSFPGCFDISTAGHIPAGCDYVESAIREAKEELGVDLDPRDLHETGKRFVRCDDSFFGVPFHDRQISKFFYAFCDKDEGDFVLQKEEVAAVVWMKLDDALTAVETNAIPHCIFLGELQKVKDEIEKENANE